MTELYYLGLLEAADRIRAGAISSVEVTGAMLDRVARADAHLKSYVHVMADTALAEARRADEELARGCDRGPLHGVPVAIKDMFWIAGEPMAAGMPLLREFTAATDATVVTRLKEAGAVLLGTLTLTEGAFAEHRHPFVAPLNPWDEACYSGASSSGSGVAVAAGLCYGSVGSESGGSLRLPAAANGVTTIKPTWGRVSRHGAFQLALTLDHIGPMARSAADAAAILGVIAGPDPQDATAARIGVPNYLQTIDRGLKGLRIGVDPEYTTSGVEPGIVEMLDRAVEVLAGAGAEIGTVTLPDVTAMIWDWFPVCAVQAAIAHEETFPSRQGEYGQALRQFLELGYKVSAIDLQRAHLRRLDFRGKLETVLEDVDALAMPVLEFDTPGTDRFDDIDDDLIAALHRFTCPFNMTGAPAIAMPGGFSASGMPRAFQLVGRHFEEEVLLAAGHAYQQTTEWHLRRPHSSKRGISAIA